MSASRANTSPIGRSIVVLVSYRTVVVPVFFHALTAPTSDSTVTAVPPIRSLRTPARRTRKRSDLCRPALLLVDGLGAKPISPIPFAALPVIKPIALSTR
jgi:hypothetical protein